MITRILDTNICIDPLEVIYASLKWDGNRPTIRMIFHSGDSVDRVFKPGESEEVRKIIGEIDRLAKEQDKQRWIRNYLSTKDKPSCDVEKFLEIYRVLETIRQDLHDVDAGQGKLGGAVEKCMSMLSSIMKGGE